MEMLTSAHIVNFYENCAFNASEIEVLTFFTE